MKKKQSWKTTDESFDGQNGKRMEILTEDGYQTDARNSGYSWCISKQRQMMFPKAAK